MKRFFLLAAAAVFTVSACDGLESSLNGNKSDNYKDAWSNLVNETSQEAQVNGNTLTYGSHTYTIVSDIDVTTTVFTRSTASVTFSNIPSGYTEFSAVYDKLLGKSLAGTAAMIPMAMEIYARNAETGKKCIELLCVSGAASDMITELKRKIVASSESPTNDTYIQRFLPAALLKGAVPGNAYAPSSPYTVQMTMTSNGVKDSPMAGGPVTYMCILTDGAWSAPQRSVDVILPYNTNYYKVYGCPGCYSQCQTIQGTWAGLQ